MSASSTRVALRHLTADDAVRKAQGVRSSFNLVGKVIDQLANQANLMARLIAAGEARRLGRTGAIKVLSVNFDGKSIRAKIGGTTNDYDTRITLAPKPGHHCTCPDWAQNGRRIGPCKHVLRLGEYWRDEKVVPELDRIDSALANAAF